MQRKISVLALVILLLCTVSAAAATIHVPADRASIQLGINAAVNGDTVLVSPGTYAEHLDFFGKRIVVKSVKGADSTVITRVVDGLALVSFGNSEDSTAAFEGFTLTGLINSPACVYFNGTSPRVADNIIRGNSGTWSLLRCDYNSNPTLVRNSVFGNQAENIIYIYYGRPHIAQNVTYNNSTSSAIYLEYGPQVPGALIENNTIVGSTGYGILSNNARPLVRNNIIVRFANYGIYRSGTGYVPTLSHNDVFGNVAGQYYGIMPDFESISLDPLFCDSANADYSLKSTSPCVGAGEGGVNIGALGVGCGASIPGQPRVLNIQIAQTGDSLHLIDHSPVISWKYFDSQSLPHTKSEIEVGTNNEWSVTEMWQPPTIVGSDTSIQYAGLPLTDGSTYYVRVRVFNDTLWSDWLVAPFRMNSVPSVPTANRPVRDSVIRLDQVLLYVNNSSDGENDPIWYDFEIFNDPALTSLVGSQSGIAQGTTPTASSLFPVLPAGVRYWWHARAFDGYEYSGWSVADSFVTRSAVIHVPSEQPTIQNGINAAVNGDTVLVAPGVYREHIDFGSKWIAVKSVKGADSTTITAVVPGLALVTFRAGCDTGSVLSGFSLNGTSSPAIEAYSPATIQYNIVSGTGGISLQQADGAIVEHNTISHSNYYGVYSYSGNSSNRGTTIRDNVLVGQGTALYMRNYSSRGTTISDNVILENGTALDIYGARFVVRGNVIARNGNNNGTIYIWGSYGFIFEHNTVVENTSGIYFHDISPDPVDSVRNNIIAFNGGYGIHGRANRPVVRQNDVFGQPTDYYAVIPDPGSIAVNPLFCDTSRSDFHLSDNSPCVAAGEGGTDMGALGIGCVMPSPEQPSVLTIRIGSVGDSMHLVNHSPLFAWKYFDQQSRPHTKSEIEVGTDNDWTVAEMWRPSTMIGPDTSIQYAGSSLDDGMTYFVRVRVFNDTLWSPWSVALFHMNAVPSIPSQLFPTDGSIALTGRPTLVVMNASDVEGDTRHYDFPLCQ